MKGIEGTTLGRYELRRRIAQGGMAEIYSGYDRRVRRQVAVKVLYGRDEAFIRRFEREALAVGALTHDHILPLYDFGQQGPWYYLVMPYVKGGNLRDYLHKRKHLTLGEAGSFVEQIAAALQCAHDHGVVHRDVKPSNILLRPDGHAYLVDFGLAKAMLATESLTNAGAVVGTPEYMAPEQSNGTSDHRSDIYSLGVILYEMLTGRLPFTAETPVAISLKHIQALPAPPHELNDEITPEIEDVILTAMAKEPGERYQEAQAFAVTYRKALKQGQTSLTTDEAAVASASTPADDDLLPAEEVDESAEEADAREDTATPSTLTLRSARRMQTYAPATPLLIPLLEAPEEIEEEQTHKVQELTPTPEAVGSRVTRAAHTTQRLRLPLIALLCLTLLLGVPLGLLWQLQQAHKLAPARSMLSNTATLQTSLSATAAVRAQAQLQATLAAQSRVQGPSGVDAGLSTGQLLYAYDMKSPGGGWVNDGYQCSFSPQGYHVQVYAPYRAAWCFSNQQQFSDGKFTVQAELLHGNIYGLVFRLNPASPSFYTLEINNIGAYRFLRATGTNPSNWLTLIDWTSSSAIFSGYGHINTFTLLAKGPKLSFYINRVFLNSFSDNMYTAGFIALLVGDDGPGGAEAVFDDVGVYQY